jgi:predicted Zn finger-like uncharacterized protein
MDVRCNRCSTDYEFDDALISDRGTTVQCTNCGYQFKIYPERSQPSAPERWVVQTTSGKELVYTTLRDLQRAIGEHKVGPKDLLSRGSQASRPLGSIPELEPFFTTASGAGRGQYSAPRTLHGVAPPSSGGARPPEPRIRGTQRGFGLPGGAREAAGFSSTLPAGDFEQRAVPSRVFGGDPEPEPPTERQPSLPPHESASAKPGVRTGVGLGMGSTQRSGTPRMDAGVAKAGGTVRLDAKPLPDFDATMPAASPPAPAARDVPPVQARGSVDVVRATAHVPTNPGPIPNFDETLPVPPPPELLPSIEEDEGWMDAPVASVPSSPRAAPAPLPPPISTREHLSSYDDIGLENVDPARRARSRWIAGVVFIGVVALLGATLGRQYLVRLSTGLKAEPARRDDRTAGFLQEGTRLLDQADYDGAEVELAKAQALSDRDPAVLAAIARLAAARADLLWLKLRLLDPTSKDLVQDTTRELGERAAKARQASDAAFAVAADDPVVIRARIDAMRIAGEESKAREWIAPIAANASDPQNAYVLAALDLSEAAPAFGTVIDRLRSAAVSDHEAMRARGALIYALVRAGRVVEAETELAKVAAGARPHPLGAELKSFVERFSAPLDAGADAAVAAPSASAAASVPATAAAVSTNSAKSSSGASTSSGASSSNEALPAGDFRSRLTHAAQALASGNVEGAYSLYQSVVGEQPNNTEALSGLADVARRRGDTGTAGRLYARVLDVNPSYLPALMAMGDMKWGAGDRSGALSYYKRVLEQVGPSTDYGQRAQSRINESERGNAAAAKTDAPSATVTSTANSDMPAPSVPTRPEIDTSDLPGVKPP